MKKNIKIIIGVLVAIVLLGGGFGLWFQNQNPKIQTPVSSEQLKTISYQGEEGKTAYDLLKEKYQVEATEGSFGVMVNSINNLKATSTEFWLYSVNGQQVDVAADKYQTHAGDTISWEYKGM